MKRRAFVTGSTGFLGLNLIGELQRRDWDVAALHLPNENLTYLSRTGAKPVPGDILDYESIARSVPDGVDAVFHLAGDTTTWSKNNQRQYMVNVIGTRNMVRASIEKNARCLIHTSSSSAYGYHKDRVISEETPSNALTCGINYHKTKYLAELEVREGLSRGLRAVIVNPCNIIGPYDFGNWSQLIRAVCHDSLPGCPPGSGTFAHVRDVVGAHISAVDNARSGENYLLGGEEASFERFIGVVGRVVGKRTNPKVISRNTLLMGVCVSWVRSLFDGKEPMITWPKYMRLVGNLRCDDSKAVSELGFVKSSLVDMVTDCYEWMRGEGLL